MASTDLKEYIQGQLKRCRIEQQLNTGIPKALMERWELESAAEKAAEEIAARRAVENVEALAKMKETHKGFVPRAELEGAEARIKDLEANYKKIQEEYNQQRDQLETMTTIKKAAEQELVTLKQQLDGLKANIAEMTANFEHSQTVQKQCKKELEERDATIAELRAKALSPEQIQAGSLKEVDELKAKLAACNEQLEKDGAKKIKELQELQKIIAENEALLGQSNEALKTIRDQMERENAEHTRVMAENDARRKDFEAKIAEMNGLLSRTTSEKDRAVKELSENALKLTEAQDALEKSVATLTQYTQQLSELQGIERKCAEDANKQIAENEAKWIQKFGELKRESEAENTTLKGTILRITQGLQDLIKNHPNGKNFLFKPNAEINIVSDVSDFIKLLGVAAAPPPPSSSSSEPASDDTKQQLARCLEVAKLYEQEKQQWADGVKKWLKPLGFEEILSKPNTDYQKVDAAFIQCINWKQEIDDYREQTKDMIAFFRENDVQIIPEQKMSDNIRSFFKQLTENLSKAIHDERDTKTALQKAQEEIERLKAAAGSAEELALLKIEKGKWELTCDQVRKQLAQAQEDLVGRQAVIDSILNTVRSQKIQGGPEEGGISPVNYIIGVFVFLKQRFDDISAELSKTQGDVRRLTLELQSRAAGTSAADELMRIRTELDQANASLKNAQDELARERANLASSAAELKAVSDQLAACRANEAKLTADVTRAEEAAQRGIAIAQELRAKIDKSAEMLQVVQQIREQIATYEQTINQQRAEIARLKMQQAASVPAAPGTPLSALQQQNYLEQIRQLRAKLAALEKPTGKPALLGSAQVQPYLDQIAYLNAEIDRLKKGTPEKVVYIQRQLQGEVERFRRMSEYGADIGWKTFKQPKSTSS